MKRKLLRQIANEWKSNVWLALELLIVSVVMWYVIDSLFVSYSIYNEPRGFNTDHCYLIEIGELNDRSADYKPYENGEQRSEAYLQLFDRLAARPEIEAVGCGRNSYIYNGSNSGTTLKTDTFTTGNNWVPYRMVSPEFPLVFRIEGANGETPEQLSEMLRNNPNGFLCSDNLLSHYGMEHMSEFIGKDFANWANGDTITLLGAYKVIRYNDYSTRASSQSMMMTISRQYYANYLNELFVRVKDNMDRNFMENLMKDAQHNLRFANFYISNVKSFDDIRANHQQGNYIEVRNDYIIMIFLSVNIFLGLLGTFWFRTQTRVPEIAIRKANGASKGDIFRRFVGEGEILLLSVTPIAVLIEWLLTHYEYNAYYGGFFSPGRFILCVVMTFALMALMIFLGTVIPANRAMRLQPAIALKEE